MNHDTSCGIINITDRKRIDLTGIISVDSFDESSVILSINSGTLNIEGEGLSITTLELEKGVVSASGLISGLYYSDSDVSLQNKGLIKRIFNKG